MKASLKEVHRRLDGASHDLDALLQEMQAAMQGDEKAVGVAYKSEPKRDSLLVYIDRTMPIPDHWDRRIAHILYDARSALDHLIHECYVASTGKRPTKLVARRLQFPICTTKRAWTSALNDPVKWPSVVHGLNKDFIDILYRYQPFRQKNKSRYSLTRLVRFNDTDKHRRPNVVLFTAANFHIAAHAGPSCRVLRIEPLGTMKTLRVGTKLARVYVAPIEGVDPNEPCARVNAEGIVLPTLKGGVQIDNLLGIVLTECRRIVQNCERVILIP